MTANLTAGEGNIGYLHWHFVSDPSGKQLREKDEEGERGAHRAVMRRGGGDTEMSH